MGKEFDYIYGHRTPKKEKQVFLGGRGGNRCVGLILLYKYWRCYFAGMKTILPPSTF